MSARGRAGGPSGPTSRSADIQDPPRRQQEHEPMTTTSARARPRKTPAKLDMPPAEPAAVDAPPSLGKASPISRAAAKAPAVKTPAVKAPRKPRKTVELHPNAERTGVAEALRKIALDLFASQNYSTVTIKDISGATGVNPSLIYYYFGSKEQLFLDVVNSAVEEAFAKFESVTGRADSPENIISAWIEIHIAQFVMLQKLAKISLDYACTSSRTLQVDKAIRKFYDKESVVLSRAIRAGVAKGIFRPVDPTEAATFISTFLDGVLFRNVMFPTFDYSAAISHMRTLVLDHLRTDAPRQTQA
ncbi:TetR/AcrR family transcriptional regulator [Pseudoxanthobacter soli]|nr:TetR/AcrR family transcriptional regulator [Pseudoxanthobacter soli]